ncbi:hypothetical protein RDI58_028245 [Solanum bulbocastanum]|uniref:Transcription factor n=1 Tax=Solanum bulbocastanum TaxID=147425 RepID=A0AAN8XZB3_SOLBU
MDKGDVEMLDAETNVPASDVLVSNESPVKYENGVKTGKSNAEDKTQDQSDSKGEDSKNARSDLSDQLNSKSQPEANVNVVLENKPPTVDAGMDDMVSGYVKAIDDELQNIEKMIYEVNQNGNDLMADRQEDSQMKTIPTNVTTDSFIGKTPEPASPTFPSTVNAGQHSEEASENICAMRADGEDDEGSPEDQAVFLGKLGTFYREKVMELKLPKFYGHPLNCLKLWRSVIRLGGYDRVTGFKLWRQVGDSFNPPKTCTTVSWTFRSFYEKLLLQYERHRTQNGELQLPIAPPPGSSGVDNEFNAPAGRIAVKDLVKCLKGCQIGPSYLNGSGYQISASERVVRDSAAHCRLGWQEQHLLGYGGVAEPIVKERSANNTPKRVKSLKTSGSLKHQGQNEVEHPMKAAETETSKLLDVQVVDVGPPADWVKINVRETNDSFEVYALVPGLLREEVRVQSDPAGRLVITGQPNQLDNLWGVTAFKKVVTLPARIDQLRTNAVVTLHGCLHVHVPFAQQNC